MKKLLYLIALTGLCAQPSYGMEKEKKKHDKECVHCINVGPCNWGNLAAQLGAMHNGPLQPKVAIKNQKAHSDTQTSGSQPLLAKASADTAGRTEADVSSADGSDDSWERESWSDATDWTNLDDDSDGEKKKEKEE